MKARNIPQLRARCRDLMLINRSHPLRDDTVPDLAAPDAAFPDIRMERRAALLLAACIRAAGAQGRIIPVSGWRSHAEQQAIWDDTLAKEGADFTHKYVAFPGCSEHETGLAIDLAENAPEIDFIRPSLPYDEICGVFRRLAPRYGFIERYREEKIHITGIAAEPWHFRYVGVPHALLMEQYGVCLEEYVELLDRRALSCTLENGRHVRVCRITDLSDAEKILGGDPGHVLQIAGDNAGGWILTEWEALP